MKRINRLFFIATLLVGTFVLHSCNDQALYDKSYNFNESTWAKKDTAVFQVNVEDTTTAYSLELTLRTKKDYLYSNLWCYILVTSPDGSTSKVAQKIPIANPNGSWIGRVSGTLVESKLRFDSKPFPLKGTYIFQITNATQEENIPFVEDISLRVQPNS